MSAADLVYLATIVHKAQQEAEADIIAVKSSVATGLGPFSQVCNSYPLINDLQQRADCISSRTSKSEVGSAGVLAGVQFDRSAQVPA